MELLGGGLINGVLLSLDGERAAQERESVFEGVEWNGVKMR